MRKISVRFCILQFLHKIVDFSPGVLLSLGSQMEVHHGGLQVDMQHPPCAVNIRNLQMESFMETEAAGIDRGQIGVVVGGINKREDLADFFLAEYGRQAVFRLSTEDIEDVPVVMQDVPVKEPDAAIADSAWSWATTC